MRLELIEQFVIIFINAFTVFLVIVVLGNSTKTSLNRWFVIMTLLIAGWVNFSYFGFVTDDLELSLVLYKLNFFFVPLFIYSAFIFLMEHTLEIKVYRVKLIIFSVSTIFAGLSLFTDLIIKGVFHQSWGNEVVFGILHWAYVSYAAIMAGILFYYFLKKYFNFSAKKKDSVLYFLIGTILLMFFNMVFNVFYPVFANTIRYQNWGDYSAIIFLAFTAYSIVKHKFIDVKVVFTAFLISVIGILLVVDIILLSDNIREQSVKSIMFTFFVIAATILVRSVVNEVKQREEIQIVNIALGKSRQSLLDLATEQKDIIDVMGHEIRTPLTAILQSVKLHKKYTLPFDLRLIEKSKVDSELAVAVPLFIDALKTIDRASTHATSLVTDMLETARLDKQRFELNYENFDLISVVKDSVTFMSDAAQAEDSKAKYLIKFVKPSFSEILVEADKTRIVQAIYALLNNAIKYRDPAKDRLEVNVSTSIKGEYAYIEISDNGIGIAKEDIPTLGKKFLRLNPKTKGNLKRPGGTGLGLFVVKGIMEHHSGEVVIESKGIGKGATLTLKLPLKRK